MATSLRILRRKIKSIQGTQKITRAMQLVAASKMARAIQADLKRRQYERLAQETIASIRAKLGEISHPLLATRPDENVGLAIITSNRGLCGSFNTNLFRKVSLYIDDRKMNKKSPPKLITVGRKARAFVTRFYADLLLADFDAPDAISGFADAAPLADFIIQEFKNNHLDLIAVASNHFISTLRYEPRIRELLPIPLPELEAAGFSSEHLFEPDPKTVLDVILPAILNTEVFQLFLESCAAEHSARMVAMKNATDNAGELIDDLTLTYQSLRQAAITREITEIAAGAEALKSI